MGLNPRPVEVLSECFNGGSPYFDMFRCGRCGVPIEDAIEKCRRNGIAVRQKDIRAYQDGAFKSDLRAIIDGDMSIEDLKMGKPFEEMKLSDFPKMPEGWTGTERRFFPCTRDNKPIGKWGWTKDYQPELYSAADARALSPCGWVGQNILYQPFIVMDIDGRGHGSDDAQVIEFGNIFKDETFAMEDPSKPGSFHLYFSTDRLIPVKHFTWAKLDLMGNAVNAAVYMKNKKSNGLPLMELDQEIWSIMLQYQKSRRETLCL